MTLKTLGPTATTNDVLAELDQAGAVIVKDVIGAQILERFNAEVMPYVERTPMGRDDFLGKSTKRTGALAARCPVTVLAARRDADAGDPMHSHIHCRAT